tara:strand:+ start:524 stop:679 length:156 start_codon:yes stop_codon:yes gene_type:complete
LRILRVLFRVSAKNNIALTYKSIIRVHRYTKKREYRRKKAKKASISIAVIT